MKKYIAVFKCDDGKEIKSKVIQAEEPAVALSIAVLALLKLEPLLLFVDPTELPLEVREIQETQEEQFFAN